MVINNETHEAYVGLEVAKLLDKVGFNWVVNSRWQNWGDGLKTVPWFLNMNLAYYEDANATGRECSYSAPTLEVAQRWLIEVKGYLVSSVLCVNRKGKGNSFGFSIGAVSEDLSDYKMIYPRSYYDEEDSKDFVKYEFALEAGIKKALELILEKGE